MPIVSSYWEAEQKENSVCLQNWCWQNTLTGAGPCPWVEQWGDSAPSSSLAHPPPSVLLRSQVWILSASCLWPSGQQGRTQHVTNALKDLGRQGKLRLSSSSPCPTPSFAALFSVCSGVSPSSQLLVAQMVNGFVSTGSFYLEL